jgi:hypothetical protein
MIRWLWALALITLGSGCTSVTPLNVQDPRLPPAARRRVADAEDAMVVARARVAATRADAAELRRTRDVRGQADFGPASTAFSALANARVVHAEATEAVAEADLAYARDRLTLTYAETAIRHDLQVYELAPLTQAVEQRRATVTQTRRSRQDARQALELATTTWWTAWRAHVKAGGDTKALWQ